MRKQVGLLTVSGSRADDRLSFTVDPPFGDDPFPTYPFQSNVLFLPRTLARMIAEAMLVCLDAEPDAPLSNTSEPVSMP